MSFFEFYENIKSEMAGKSQIWVVYHYDYEGRSVTGKTFYSNEAVAKSQDGPWSKVDTQEVIGDYKPGQPIYSTTSYFYGDPGDKGHTTYYANKEGAGPKAKAHQVFSTAAEAAAASEKEQQSLDAATKSREEREIAAYPDKINKALNDAREEIAQMVAELQSANVDNLGDAVNKLYALEQRARSGYEYLKGLNRNYSWNLKQQKERQQKER
jgi:hypothetical protein